MKSNRRYKLLYENDKSAIFINSFTNLAVFISSLPLGGFIFCVLWSLLFNFTESTSTHCRVPNYLPSISAAVGSYSPQKYIWRICIAIHSAPRYLVAYMYYSIIHGSFVTLVFNLVEISSLIGLTFISSTENHFLHALNFALFIITGSVGMTLVSDCSYKSRKIKNTMKYINLISIVLAIFFYYKHNWFCEPGVYTLFALSEYIVVLTNIVFHFQAYHDFKDYDIVLINRLSLTSS